MATGRHLGFDPTGNGTIRSAVPENPTLERKTKSIGWCVAELWPFQVFHSLAGERTPDIGYRRLETVCDFIFCPICCYAMHWTDNKQINTVDRTLGNLRIRLRVSSCCTSYKKCI